jgi:GT2 family glycosyltransferase
VLAAPHRLLLLLRGFVLTCRKSNKRKGQGSRNKTQGQSLLCLMSCPLILASYLAILQLSIIIVNYNVRYFLEQCLYSVQHAVVGMDVEVMVVDNDSTDGSVSYLKPLFPSVEFITNEKNLGFAKANNQALAICKGEYVLFLNPDTLIPEDCLQKCLAFIKGHPRVGALGIRMLDGKGRFLPESKRSFPSPWISLFKLTGLSAIFPKSRIFNRYALGFLDEHSNHPVDVLAGAFMLVKKELLIQLHGFDESYFLYGEDIDLSYRIKQAGYANMYFSETAIIHFKGESSGIVSLNRVKHFYSAMQVFVKKHYHSGSAKLLSVFLTLAIALRGFISVLNRLLKPILLPLIDCLIVWACLQFFRMLWINEIRDGKDFGVSFIPYALPAFSIWFVLSAAFTGSYDRKFQTSKMLLSLAFAVVSTLAAYSLLPESFRFSRGVILCGGLIAALLIFLLRQFLLLANSSLFVPETEGQTIVVSTEAEYAGIKHLLEAAAADQQLLGRVSVDDGDTAALCSIKNIRSIKKNFTINKVIFCIGKFSLNEILAQIAKYHKHNTRFLFHTVGSGSMVGSQTLTPGATIVTPFIDYRITHPYQQRMKRVVDIFLSLFFILTIPFHFLLHPQPMSFIRAVFSVLKGSQTWVGYTMESASLPFIKKSIIPSAGKTKGPAKNVFEKSDRIYAKDYDWWQDIVIVFSNYRQAIHKP